MTDEFRSIPPENFYGIQSNDSEQEQDAVNFNQPPKFNIPKRFTSLLGPSQTWQVFKKQEQAVEYAKRRRNGLKCFAFEQSNGKRLFLTCHPIIFWFIDLNKNQKCRCSYEVIVESTACKLYFDIEFSTLVNNESNGNEMLKIFTSIVNKRLKEKFDVNCGWDNILDLDSSTDEKFSHHLIYLIPDTAFENNFVVGDFVKELCYNIKEGYNNVNEASKKFGVTENDFLSLFVKDKKGNRILFCDEGVYTKNRHFRLLGSSKYNKNSPLVISKSNQYSPRCSVYEEKHLAYFLDSLITYFSFEVNRIICNENLNIKNIKNCDKKEALVEDICLNQETTNIDKFIQSFIEPKGYIRKKINISSDKIVYEIAGFRFCYNIGREHKSNNIKLIVDLNNFVFYQKCYDPDCFNFKSQCMPLPQDIKCLYEEEEKLINFVDTSLNSGFDESDLMKLCSELENDEFDLNNFPEFGLSDNEILTAIEI